MSSILVIKLKNCFRLIIPRLKFDEFNCPNIIKFISHNVEYTRHKVEILYSIYYSKNQL